MNGNGDEYNMRRINEVAYQRSLKAHFVFRLLDHPLSLVMNK